jgi:hypothetical protein
MADYIEATSGGGEMRGLYERIAIKDVQVKNNQYTEGKNAVLYVDTFNAIWNEWDLITREEADILVEEYWQGILARFEASF